MPQVAKINGYRIGGICNDDVPQDCNAYGTSTATYLSYTNSSWKSGSTYNLDVSGICKAGDGCYYEVFIAGDITSAATSGQQASLLAYTKTNSSDSSYLMEANLCEVIPRSAAAIRQGNAGRLIIPPNNRYIYLKNNRSGTSASTIHFYVRKIRRLAKAPVSNKVTKIGANSETYTLAGKQFPNDIIAWNNETILNQATIAQGGTKDVDLSAKLTDANTDWECHFMVQCNTVSSTGKTGVVGIYAGRLSISEANRYARTWVVSRTNNAWCNDMNIDCVIPANDRYLRLYNGGNDSVTFSVMIGARRRASNAMYNNSGNNYISSVTIPSGTTVNFDPIQADVCDGPFVPSVYNFASDINWIETSTSSTNRFTISNYLPTNDELYLVYVSGRFDNYVGSNTIARPRLDSYSDSSYSARIERICLGGFRTNSTSVRGRCAAFGTIVCKQVNGKIYLEAVANSGGTETTSSGEGGWMDFYGYRKLSKNTSYV